MSNKKPQFKIGDKVTYHGKDRFYHNKIFTIVEIYPCVDIEESQQYRLHHSNSSYKEEDLRLITSFKQILDLRFKNL